MGLLFIFVWTYWQTLTHQEQARDIEEGTKQIFASTSLWSVCVFMCIHVSVCNYVISHLKCSLEILSMSDSLYLCFMLCVLPSDSGRYYLPQLRVGISLGFNRDLCDDNSSPSFLYHWSTLDVRVVLEVSLIVATNV